MHIYQSMYGIYAYVHCALHHAGCRTVFGGRKSKMYVSKHSYDFSRCKFL